MIWYKSVIAIHNQMIDLLKSSTWTLLIKIATLMPTLKTVKGYGWQGVIAKFAHPES